MDDTSLASLPDDPQQLRAMILSLASERDQWKARHDQMRAERDEKELERLRLELRLLQLLKRTYGRKADRLSQSGEVAQLLLDFAREQLEPLPPPTVEDAEGIADDRQPLDPSATDIKQSRKIRRGRRNLAAFEHLPTIRQEHDLPDEQKPCGCCGTVRVQIGQETTWQLEYIPGHFQRIEHIQYKYACPTCEAHARGPNIVLSPKPPQPIDKGLPGPGLLAFVVASKFADYLPLYRLEDLFARAGVEVGRATMSVWCRDVARLLEPLFGRMTQRVLASRVICTDDTIMPMLSPGQGKTRAARMWVYVGDEANPYDIFDFTLSRNRDGPQRFLRGFSGTLLADAYGGYDGVVTGNDLTRAGCWAHARRKFIDAQPAHPAIARAAVEQIGQLYAVEREAKALTAEERRSLRQQRSAPILRRLHQQLSDWRQQLTPKHPMNQAIGYALRQWNELSLFAVDGRVPIDNNLSEREMKRVVLNRKNSLFVGNEEGGRTAAILSSLTSTCRRHEVDPQRYLTHLLMNLASTPLSAMEEWLPDRWKQAN